MISFDYSRTGLLFVLAAAVAASGCVQSSSTTLKPDFDLTHQDVELNSTGYSMYQDSMSQISNSSNYSSDSDNRMAMNLPVISLAVNMSSVGVFDQEDYGINSSGSMTFNVAGRSNSTEFETKLSSSGNETEIYREIRNSSNSTEVGKIDTSELGISLEALEQVDVENASIIGRAQINAGNSTLLKLDVNSSSLVWNSENIFEKLSLIQRSSEDGQGLSDVGGFNSTSAYLWVSEDENLPMKFAYYGSVDNGTIQVRSVTEYME